MKWTHGAIALAIVAALFGCKKNERAAETTTTGANTATTTGNTGNGTGTGTTTGSNMGSNTGSTTTTGSLGTTTHVVYDNAMSRIVTARCAREVQCDQVGANKRYATHDACTREIGQKTRAELQANACPNGFDAKKLESCVDEIAKEDCSDMTEPLAKLDDDCKTSSLCVESR
jgi:hypothetical protein